MSDTDPNPNPPPAPAREVPKTTMRVWDVVKVTNLDHPQAGEAGTVQHWDFDAQLAKVKFDDGQTLDVAAGDLQLIGHV